MDPGEYSLALIYKSGDTIILANGRAERKIKENFGSLVKDILEIGYEAYSSCSRKFLKSSSKFGTLSGDMANFVAGYFRNV